MKKNKKVLAALCAAALLAGCGGSSSTGSGTTEPAKVEETTLKVGIGSSTSITAKPVDGDTDGSVQVNTTFASVALDGDTIKYVYFDVAQNTGKFNASGAITSDKDAATPTKKEKKDDYGMKKASGIGKEWFEQAAGLEEWAVGKTVSDFENMKLDEKGYSADDDLKTAATVNMSAFVEAFKAAVDNAQEVKGAVKIGTGSKTSMGLKDASADASGQVQSNVTYAVVALDADGKILLTQDDVSQQTVKFKADGTLDGEAAVAPTKMEKKEDYGMKKASGIGKEWYEQNEGFMEWTVGKTADDLSNLPTEKTENGHVVTTDADLKTVMTISVPDFQAAVLTAIDNAVEVK